MRPSVSVTALVPTYNRRSYVMRALDSIIAQPTPVEEIVVVDDGSTDGSAEAIDNRYGNRVRVIRQPNMGVSGARLRAVCEAHGEWIAFLDSDDEWLPGRNQAFAEAVTAVPSDVAWIFGDVTLVEDSGEAGTIFEKFGLQLKDTPHVFEDSMTVQYPFQFGLLEGSLIRRNALLEVGAFSSDLHHSEDFLTGIQVACRYRFAAISSVVTKVNRNSDLRESSLDLAGRGGTDYFRARMAAFSLILQTGRKGQWDELYADAVRGLCKSLADKQGAIRLLALEQFRFCISTKGVAFGAAAMFGRSGMKVWKAVGRMSRAARRQRRSKDLGLGWNQ